MSFAFLFPLEEAEGFEALEMPERLIVWGCRAWVFSRAQGLEPIPTLMPTFNGHGVPEAVFSLNAALSIVAAAATRTFLVRGPACQCLSDDEKDFVNAAAAMQSGETDVARTLLSAWLPPAAADMALGPVSGLAELFARAGLRLPERARRIGDHERRTLH